MLNYFYYKLYQAVLKGSLKDIPEFIAPVFLSGLIGINIIVVHIFLVKINLMPYLFTEDKQGGIFITVLIILGLFYFKKAKRVSIINKYSSESNSQRIKGNVIVSVYVLLSFLLIFLVAFFKPGYLPKWNWDSIVKTRLN